MSISITTVSFAERRYPGARPDAPPFDETLDAMLAGLFGAPQMPTYGPALLFVPQVPTPVSTAEFPDRSPRATGRSRPARGEKRTRTDCCPVCLEPETCGARLLALPCGHTMHRLCAFALLTAPILGARSMLRRPLCRQSLDRYD